MDFIQNIKEKRHRLLKSMGMAIYYKNTQNLESHPVSDHRSCRSSSCQIMDAKDMHLSILIVIEEIEDSATLYPIHISFLQLQLLKILPINP